MNKSIKIMLYRKLLTISVIFAFIKLISIPFNLILARKMAEIVSCAINGNVNEVLYNAICVILFVVIFKTSVAMIEILFKKRESVALHKCKIELYNQFLSKPLYSLYTSEYGQTIENLNDDFDTVTGYIVNSLPGLWINIISAISYTSFIYVQSKPIAATLVILSLLQFIPPFIVKNFLEINYERCREVEAQLTEYTLESYRGFLTIKLNNLSNWWIERLRKLHKKYEKVGSTSILTNQTEIAINTIVDNILKFGTYAIVGVFVLYKISSLEVSIQAITLSGGLFKAINGISSIIPSLTISKKASARLSEWFEQKKDKFDLIKNQEIVLDKVSFINDDKILFSNISKIISTNKITLIKGENGAGKSTLLKLILGLLECKAGKILVGDVEPKYFSDNNFPNNILYVPQDDIGFNFTAKELYSLVLRNDLYKVKNICSQFKLSERVINDTKIKDLSGGERKKVFLSLALALEPQLLFLDEPTNSLDDKSKIVLCRQIAKISSNVVIVTHDSVFDNLTNQVWYLVKEN